MKKINNIENTGNVKNILQSRKETVMKRARRYVMSLAFAAVAIFTVLFSGAGTAQAQNVKCYYNDMGVQAIPPTSATCPINDDSGYYYQRTDRGWQPVSYYKGASTNILYVYAYALRRWGAIKPPKGAVYIWTTSGWTPASDSDPLVRIVLDTENRPSGIMNVRPNVRPF